MARPDASSCFSGFELGSRLEKPSRREKPQQLACDRCRGQKLRCMRSASPNAPCERCQKAGATCIIDSSVRMGRPKRTPKNQSGESSGSSRNPSQPRRSPPLATKSSQTTTTVDFTPNSDAWLVHGLDDTPIDPTLQSVTMQYLDSFDFALHGEATGEDESAGRPTEHYLDPTMDLSLGESIPALTEDEGAAIDATETLNDYSRFPPMRQETMQELSDLNMQLSRQLGAVGSTANKHTNIHSGAGLTALATPRGENRTLCDVVVFMMHGLQTYHRLLVEILGFTGPTHSAMYDSRDNPKSSAVTASLLSPIEGVDCEDSRGRMAEATGRPPRKRLRSDNRVEFTARHDSSQSANLDMPTSLLLLSCHTNLIYLCRDAFAAIRAALSTTNGHITLFTISFLNNDAMSMPPDPDLQIIVLIQAVIGMIDRIGRLLGYPDDCEVDSGGERCESNARSSAIPRRLLDLLLRSETCGEGPADRVGTKALREEIRRLHELVYKPV
ncbi:Fungal Zn binuclear cluster domain containing protein [Ilyonectria robusta]